ncbi:MAG TPA: ATP-binding protein [Acidimicrobiia bacterium]|jgi:signal transduction histidine kinase
MRPWSTIRARVLLVPLLPAIALGLIVGFDLHRSVGVVIAAVVAVVAAFAIALIVARSITRPLRDLAVIVADTRALRAADGITAPGDDVLPPRYTHSASPLAELAVAVADGRRRATEIVSEQRSERRSITDLLANLALRNERLLGAALDALGEIGRRDHEPATTAAIARVHRVVARVDRSTASALVLIGEGGRVAPYPVSITDAVWAAALAIESSDRVDAESLPPAMLHADVVGDATHLLAELIDNAVAASAPPARVTVLGVPDEDGGYEITVLDVGTGLEPADLELANERVRRLEMLHRVPTRHIGLDVVGRLARRHNIVVRLGESAEGGIVVRVLLPPSMLTAPAVTTPSWVHSADDAPVPDAPVPDAEAPSPVEAWHVDTPLPAPLPDVLPAPLPESLPAPVMTIPVAPEPDPVEAPVVASEPVVPEIVVPPEPVVVASEVAVAPEIVVAPEPAPIEWSIDLTALEHDERHEPETSVLPPSDDEMLPHRESPAKGRKWAAAIARARN